MDQKMPAIDETGVRYGKLVVESFAGRTKFGMALWVCRCDCGNVKTIRVGCLRDGSSKSCGCGLSAGFKEATGQRFGRLMAIRCTGVVQTHAMWDCICDCGNQCNVSGHNLRRGGTRSCGCLNAARTHGKSRTPEHSVWKGMRQRCENANNPKYPIYGGRGIRVCERWKDFANFLEDMGPRPAKNMQIDRIDTNRDYEPGNCRWATCKKNNRNRRDNRVIAINGVERCLAEWAELSGLKIGTVWKRLKSGWTPERAVTEHLDKKKSNKTL